MAYSVRPHIDVLVVDVDSTVHTRADDEKTKNFDNRLVRMRRFSFAICAAGFAQRHVSVVQTVLVRGDRRSPPRSRHLRHAPVQVPCPSTT